MTLYVYNGKLYFGTMNFESGAGLYVSTDDDGTMFEALFKDGNENRMNAYVWYLQEYNGRLYIGTFKMFGEFDLYSTGRANRRFRVETTTGFESDGHYGIRSMALYQDKLMIGSATAKLDHACKIFQTDLLEYDDDGLQFSSNSEQVSQPIIHDPSLMNHDDKGMVTIQVAAIIFGFGFVFLCIGIWISKNGNSFQRLEKHVNL